MKIMGIDPGVEGGFAILDGDSVIVEPMPQNPDGKIDFVELNRLLAHYAPELTKAYVEVGQMRPGQSLQVTYACGFNHGALTALLAALEVKVELVFPQTWSREYEHGVKEKDRSKRYAAIKVARRGIVARIFPGIDLKKSERSSVPHEGMVDALLIAHYGWQLIHK